MADTMAAREEVCRWNSGLIRRQEGSRSGFSTLKKAFRLLVEGSDDKPPDDIAYTYSGCAVGLSIIGWV